MIDVTEDLAPGVRGYTVEHQGELWIPIIWSLSPGKGCVGAYLDALCTNRTIVFPAVISVRLEGMLTRRGFHVEWRENEVLSLLVECWVRYGRRQP